MELAVTVLKNSNFVVWPDAGGYLDQSVEWIDDLLTYMALERRAQWEHDQQYGENDVLGKASSMKDMFG